MASKYRLWATALTVVFLSIPALAQPVPIKNKATPPGEVSRAEAIQISKHYISVHETWAWESVYASKHVGSNWLVGVRPKSFHGDDGPEHLIVIDKRGRVAHYYRSD